MKAAGFIKETAILYDGKSSKNTMDFDAKFPTTTGISDPSYPDNWIDTNTLVKGEPLYLIYFYGNFGDTSTITKLSEIGYNNEGFNFIWNSSVNQLVPTNTTIDFTCTLK